MLFRSQRQRPDRSAAARGAGAARGEREAARTAETRPAAQGESMMLHPFLDERPWFRAKRHGYGTGLPIAWQGWVLLAAHVALIAGVATLLRGQPVAMTVLVVVAAPSPMRSAGRRAV